MKQLPALLHDAIEDAPKELGPSSGAFVRKWIGLKFGSCVQAIVDACTDADTRDESGKKLDWTVRKAAYIAAIAQKPAAACLVSAADKVHNARAILRDFNADREHVWERFNKDAGGPDAIVGYYRGLADALTARAEQLDDARVSMVVRYLRAALEELERAVGFTGVWPPHTREGRGE